MLKTIAITGTNRGIGLELCRLYKNLDHRVFAICRKSSAELEALDVEIIDGIDVSNSEQIEQLKNKLKSTTIDILINNAGIFLNETLDDMNLEQIQRQFEVNTLGPLRVSMALLDNLTSGSKIALITSRMGSISDNTSGGYYGYRMTKTALNSVGMSLAQDLKATGISVGLFHPGFVQTEMVGYAGDISPQTAAQRLSMRIEELNLDNTGGFWHSNGETLPW